jgi:hypothetical protein
VNIPFRPVAGMRVHDEMTAWRPSRESHQRAASQARMCSPHTHGTNSSGRPATSSGAS